MFSKNYTELSDLLTFEERYLYLRLNGVVGAVTFGFDRYVNQKFYRSTEWRSIRDFVITRDCGCDLGIPGEVITGKIYIHHMNPISIQDIERSSERLLSPEYLICVSDRTHNALHYGDDEILQVRKVAERSLNDTSPWLKEIEEY